MPSLVEVTLEGGQTVMCTVLERSYNPDIGARVIWCAHEGNEFMAVRRFGAWRKWTAKDRARPLVDFAEREKATGRDYPD